MSLPELIYVNTYKCKHSYACKAIRGYPRGLEVSATRISFADIRGNVCNFFKNVRSFPTGIVLMYIVFERFSFVILLANFRLSMFLTSVEQFHWLPQGLVQFMAMCTRCKIRVLTTAVGFLIEFFPTVVKCYRLDVNLSRIVFVLSF